MGEAGLLLGAWTAVAWAIAHVNGYFSVLALALLGGAAVLLTVQAARSLTPRPALLRRGLTAAGLLLLATPVLHRQVQAPYTGPGLAWTAATLLSGAAAVVLGGALLLAATSLSGGLPTDRPDVAVAPVVPEGLLRAAGLAAALAVAGDIAVLVADPRPAIDVHVLLQDSADGLLAGRDMYDQTWQGSPGAGLTDVYPYLPATTLLLAPARWLFGDVRVGLLLAQVATVVLLVVVARRAVAGGAPPVVLAIPVLLLASPRAVLLTQQSWTEPLLLLLLTGCVLAAQSGRGRLAVVCLGLALASKQHMALLVPIAAAWPALGVRRTAAAVGLGVAVVSPWLLADPGAFLHDAVSFQLAYPVLPQALDLPALLLRSGVRTGFALTAVALVLAVVVAVRRVRRPGAEADGAAFAGACALVLLAVALTNKQSFFNHHWLVGGLCVVAAALRLAGQQVVLRRATAEGGVARLVPAR